MTTMTTPSYADVLHRLSLGQSVWGGELRRLTDISWSRPLVADQRYPIHELPDLVIHVLVMAALHEGEDAEQLLPHACEINDHLASDALRGQPVPEHVRGLLWDIATRVDLAQKLSEV